MPSYLYHYTNPSGANGIECDMVIRTTPADSKFAWFGEGVYLTSLSPSSGRKAILWNNHRKTSTNDPNLWAKTSVFFKFNTIYLSKAKMMRTKDRRDVYINRKAINLNVIPYERGLTDNEYSSSVILGNVAYESNRRIAPESNYDYNYSPPPTRRVVLDWEPAPPPTTRTQVHSAYYNNNAERIRLAAGVQQRPRDECCIIL